MKATIPLHQNILKLNRRNLIKVAASCGSILAGMGELSKVYALTGTLNLEEGGRDFSPETRKERQAIPSACWQCVAKVNKSGKFEIGFNHVYFQCNCNNERPNFVHVRKTGADPNIVISTKLGKKLKTTINTQHHNH